MSEELPKIAVPSGPPVVRTRKPVARKRFAEDQLTPDGEPEFHEDGNGEKQEADAATLATRRIVKVRREPAQTATSEVFKTALAGPGQSTTAAPLQSGWGAAAPTAPKIDNSIWGKPGAKPEPQASAFELKVADPVDTAEKKAAFAFGSEKAEEKDTSALQSRSFSFGSTGSSFPPKPEEAPKPNPETKKGGSPLTAAPSANAVPNVFGAGSSFSFSFNKPPTAEPTEDPSKKEVPQPTPEAAAAALAAATAGPIDNGESNDVTEFAGTLKLYVLKEKEWVDKGLGTVHVNWTTESSPAYGRLIVRTAQTKNVLLNARLNKSFTIVKRDEKALVFTVPVDEHHVESYLLKAVKTVSEPVQLMKDFTAAVDKLQKRTLGEE